MSRFQTVKGLFGQLIHYKDGIRVGESWEGLFKGSYNHYSDAEGYVGYSDPGFFADQVHHNPQGDYIGESWKDDFGITRHYDQSGRIGESCPGFFGTTNTSFKTGFDSDVTIFDEPTDSDW